mmetsp:Transcript_9309/g.38189  ORF Transcript_9309/g.38189 Transcript_9309/m.38189 type:complete len:301 (-) Transcript_9309:772-1674(-)
MDRSQPSSRRVSQEDCAARRSSGGQHRLNRGNDVRRTPLRLRRRGWWWRRPPYSGALGGGPRPLVLRPLLGLDRRRAGVAVVLGVAVPHEGSEPREVHADALAVEPPLASLARDHLADVRAGERARWDAVPLPPRPHLLGSSLGALVASVSEVVASVCGIVGVLGGGRRWRRRRPRRTPRRRRRPRGGRPWRRMPRRIPGGGAAAVGIAASKTPLVVFFGGHGRGAALRRCGPPAQERGVDEPHHVGVPIRLGPVARRPRVAPRPCGRADEAVRVGARRVEIGASVDEVRDGLAIAQRGR